MSLNKILLIGNCGQVPQIRTVGENKVANFTLATTEKYKDREETEWHNVAVWGRLAEVVEKYVDKGTQLYVEGRIKTEKYTKDGQDKFITRIMASSLQLLGRKPDGQSAPASAPAPQQRPQYKTTPIVDDLPDDDSGLPFN
jgi:single-strand DNA-binding protein